MVIEKTDFIEQHQPKQCLITRFLESKFPYKIKNPLMASIFKLNLIPNILIVSLFYFRFSQMTFSFIFTYSTFFLWLNLAPYLIWLYDERFLPNFFQNSFELIPDTDKLTQMWKKYENKFQKRFWIPLIPWTSLMVVIFFMSDSSLANGGIPDSTDYFYWIFFALFLYNNFIASFGLQGVIVALTGINKLSKERLHIDPLHPDKVGGLSCVGDFAISTTIIFSSGALWLPLAFELASSLFILNTYIIIIVGVWMLFTLITFAYPTFKIHKAAEIIQNETLDKLRKDYAHTKRNLAMGNLIESKEYLEAIAHFFNLEVIYKEIINYQNVKLYPFEIRIFAKLVSSVLFPLLVWAVQTYLPGLFGF